MRPSMFLKTETVAWGVFVDYTGTVRAERSSWLTKTQAEKGKKENEELRWNGDTDVGLIRKWMCRVGGEGGR
jgi:hypothetical protein